MTAISNDNRYEDIFSDQIKQIGKQIRYTYYNQFIWKLKKYRERN